MQNNIIKHKVQHPLLQKYIKFFWELRIEHCQLNHKLIPQGNINMRINLSDTPHRIGQGNDEREMDGVYFLGLHNQYSQAFLKLNGNIDVLGICFLPYGVFPFLKIPVSEFKNQIVGAVDTGFKGAKEISERLKEVSDTKARLVILENELLRQLDAPNQQFDRFQRIFNVLTKENPIQLGEFCLRNGINIRQIERLYLKYIGLPPNTYTTLSRFHGSLNQLLSARFTKLTDLAYDNEYFDQMHFIKEFKRYTGSSPKSFIARQNSILQIGKLV